MKPFHQTLAITQRCSKVKVTFKLAYVGLGRQLSGQSVCHASMRMRVQILSTHVEARQVWQSLLELWRLRDKGYPE